MIAAFVALVVAFAMDIAATVQLVEAGTSLTPPLGFLVLHALASILAAGFLSRLLPVPYRETSIGTAMFLWMVAFFIPVLGLSGLVAALLPAFWKQRIAARRTDWLHASLSEPLGYVGAQGITGPERVDRCLSGILRCSPQHSSRLRALIATLPLDAQRAVPLLRIGLLDRDDDIRLLAYSLLARKEKALEDRIGKTRCLLDDGEPGEARSAHRALAYDYWELSALSREGCSNPFLLDQAQRHAEVAVTLQPTEANLQFLLGRILLKKAKLEAARVALLRAIAGGIGLHIVAPFLAEVAFHRGDFRQIGVLLKMGECGRHASSLRALCTYWQEAEHGR